MTESRAEPTSTSVTHITPIQEESKNSTVTSTAKMIKQDSSPAEQHSLIQKYRNNLLKKGAQELEPYRKYNQNLDKALQILSSPTEKERNASTLLAGYPVNNPFGLMVHAMQALSVISKESGGFFSGSDAEPTRQTLLIALNHLVSFVDENMGVLEEGQKQSRDTEIEQLKNQLQEEKNKNEKLVERNNALKELNILLKKQAEKHEQEGNLYNRISSSLSEIGSLVSNSNTTRMRKKQPIASSSSLTPIPSRSSALSTVSIESKKEQKERDLATDCARIMKYWSPERVFLSAILTDAVYYSPENNRLKTILQGLKSDSSLKKMEGVDSLVTYFEEYLKQPLPLLSEEEKASLRIHFTPLIRGLYKQQILPEEVINRLAEWKKADSSSNPRFTKTAHPFVSTIERLGKIKSPTVDPVLSEQSEADKNLKCYRLLKDNSFLPPYSAEGIEADVQVFQQQYSNKQLSLNTQITYSHQSAYNSGR